MNKIVLMCGSIIFGYFLLLAISPDYEKVEKKLKNIDKHSYLVKVNFVSFLISLMINFLIWGWFI